MVLISDTAQKTGKHDIKESWWSDNNIELIKYPLPCGDYILMNDSVKDLIERKNKRGIAVKKMDFLGTYNTTVDSKYGIQEIIGDICGKQHDRFRDELCLAQNNNIKLYVLIEDDGGWVDKKQTIYNKPCNSINDLFHWINPRSFIWYKGKQKYPNATKGKTLAKAMLTIENKYHVEFKFCKSVEAGSKIIELLSR